MQRSAGLGWRLAALTTLYLGLVACDGTTAPGSPEAGSDATAPTAGDAADSGESDHAAGPTRDAAGDGGAVRMDAASGTTIDGGDAAGLGDGDASGLRDGDAAGLGDADGAAVVAGDGAAPLPTAATAYLDNPAHTSSVIDPSLAPPLEPIWSFDPALGVNISYPLIAAGRVYFVYGSTTSGSTQQLVAVDEHTGATIWGPVDLGTYGLAGQAYDGEQVFTAGGQVVRAFNAATGALSWTQSLPGAQSAGIPTAYRGLVYVAGDGVLTALDEATGNMRWTASLDGNGTTSPAVTDDGVFVALGCQDNYAFDRSTGALSWHHLAECTGLGAVPMVFGGRVYVTEIEPTPQHTDVFDARNGGLLGTLSCYNFSAFDNGRAYCVYQTQLLAFDLTTGAQTWTFSGDKQLNLVPLAAGGMVYVPSNTGKMFAVDESAGSLGGSSEADGLGAAGPTAAGEGVLLVQLYGNGGVVAYAHADQPDASVTLGDGAAPMQSTPVPSAKPFALALDATNVYWADFTLDRWRRRRRAEVRRSYCGARPRRSRGPSPSTQRPSTSSPRRVRRLSPPGSWPSRSGAARPPRRSRPRTTSSRRPSSRGPPRCTGWTAPFSRCPKRAAR